MSYVIAAPATMAATATDLATVGSNLSAAHLAAAAPTVAVIPAAADEVSAGIAHLFSGYAQGYQALAGQAAGFHEHFVLRLTAGAGSYVATEAANASLLHPLNAVAGTSISTLPGEILNLGQTAPALLQSLIDTIATATPRQLLFAALVTLLSPIWLPVAVALGGVWLLLVASTIAQLPPGTLI